MQELTEQLYAEKVAQLSRTIAEQQAVIVALTWVAGKGKRVAITKGQQRQADKAIAEIEWRRLSTGELRISVIPPEGDT